MKIPGFFEFKHGGQAYFGIYSSQSSGLRSCIIIEDTPRPYLNWLTKISAHFNLKLAAVLPFSNESIHLLLGESVSFSAKETCPELVVPDPSQCVVILDMHNDPDRMQAFEGYDSRKPDLAGLQFWKQVPSTRGLYFLIASRFSRENFRDVGLQPAFVEINKSELMINPDLPTRTGEELLVTLRTIYEKADLHARCEMKKTGDDEYTIHHFSDVISPVRGKSVTRLYYLLKHQRISNNELCRLSGSPYRKDEEVVGKGLVQPSGREEPPHANASKSASGVDLASTYEMYRRARNTHKECAAEYEKAKKEAEARRQNAEQRGKALQQELTRIRFEAEDHFQETYGCSFSLGTETHGDLFEQTFLSEDERKSLEQDFDRYQARMEPLVRELQSIEDGPKTDEPDLQKLAARLRAIGQQRDELYRELHGIAERQSDGGPNPDETIRKDFLDAKSNEKRGVYYRLRQAGASDALIDHLKRNIVSYGSGLQYVGTIDWLIT